MTLGADISDLTADSRAAASKGLSIVVPCYNEGAGLVHLHERISALALKLKQTYGLSSEVIYVDDGSARRHARRGAGPEGDDPRRQRDFAVAQLRQGGGADGRPRSCPTRRRGAVHGRRRPASAGAGRDAGEALDRGRLRRRLHGEGPSQERVHRAAPCGARLLFADELPRPAQDTAGRRRLPPALAACSRGAAPASRAQPLLQGAVELDRLSAKARGLPPGSRARTAAPRSARAG